MELDIREARDFEICVGDIVMNNTLQEICFVAYVETAVIKNATGDKEQVLIDMPYMLISIKTGVKIDSFATIEHLSQRCHLILSSKNAVITRRLVK